MTIRSPRRSRKREVVGVEELPRAVDDVGARRIARRRRSRPPASRSSSLRQRGARLGAEVVGHDDAHARLAAARQRADQLERVDLRPVEPRREAASVDRHRTSRPEPRRRTTSARARAENRSSHASRRIASRPGWRAHASAPSPSPAASRAAAVHDQDVVGEHVLQAVVDARLREVDQEPSWRRRRVSSKSPDQVERGARDPRAVAAAPWAAARRDRSDGARTRRPPRPRQIGRQQRPRQVAGGHGDERSVVAERGRARRLPSRATRRRASPGASPSATTTSGCRSTTSAGPRRPRRRPRFGAMSGRWRSSQCSSCARASCPSSSASHSPVAGSVAARRAPRSDTVGAVCCRNERRHRAKAPCSVAGPTTSATSAAADAHRPVVERARAVARGSICAARPIGHPCHVPRFARARPRSPAAPASSAPTSRSRWPSATPTGRSSPRQPPPARLGAEPAAPARGGRRVRARRRARAEDLARVGRDRRARRVLGRAVGDGGRRRRAATSSSSTNLLGAYHCLELARPPRRAGRLPLDQPRLSGRRARARSRSREAETRFELADEQPLAGRLADGHRRGLPARRARARSTARRSSRPSCCSPSTPTATACARSIDRCGVIAGPWQMGKVDQGVFTPLDARALLRAPARLHRLRRHRQAGARPAARRRPRRPGRRRSSRDPSTGPARRSTSAAGAAGSLSLLRDDRAVPRAHRQRRRRRRRSRRRGRATCRVYLSDCSALFAHSELAPAAHAARRSSRTSSTGSATTRRAVGGTL